MSNDVLIGIDLGGTRVRAARFSAGLEMEQRTETLTLSEEGPEAVIGRMVEQARAVWPTDRRVAGVGVSAPGPIDPFAGVITAPPNLKGWHNVELRKRLEAQLGAKVYVGNDANLAALAETEMGAAKGFKHVIFLTISTGVGGGVIIDGKMLLGIKGYGAELGHILMITETDHVSSLEKETSGTALARQAVAALEAGENSLISDMAEGNLDMVDARMVGQAAQAGDKLGRRLIIRAGRMIGLGVVTFLHTFNPQIVVIGGSVALHNWELLTPPLWEAIKKHALDASYWEALQIVQPALGENVSLIGAATVALRQGG